MMASGQETNSFQSSFYKGSTEDCDASCGQCLKIDGNDLEAHWYCADCGEFLCAECFKAHRKNMGTRYHQLLDKSDASITPNRSETCTEICKEHGREIIKFYCRDHKKVGCNDCIVLHHRTCEIDYIPKICKGIADTLEYRDTIKKLDGFLKGIRNIEKNIEDRVNKLERKEEAVIQNLESLQNSVKIMLEKTKGKQMEKIGKVTKVCHGLTSEVERSKSVIQDYTKSKMDGQVFVSVKMAGDFLKSQDVSAIRSMLQDTNTVEEDEGVSNPLDKIVAEELLRINGFDIHTRRKSRKEVLVSTIYIGDTRCTFAFLQQHFFQKDTTSVECQTWIDQGQITQTTPNCVLLNPDKSFNAFGYEAEDNYDAVKAAGEEDDYFYFKCFTSQLHNTVDFQQNMEIKTENGRSLNLTEILAVVINYLKEKALDSFKNFRLTEKDIFWVLTIPVIWNAQIEDNIRQASEKAWIPKENMAIVDEHVASLCFCSHIPKQMKIEGNLSENEELPFLRLGAKYMVVDAGDQCTTVSFYEAVKCDELKELGRVHNCDLGGKNVDPALHHFLEEIAGKDTLDQFETENPGEVADICKQKLEVLKKSTTSNMTQLVTLQLPADLYYSISSKHKSSSFQTNELMNGGVRLSGGKLRLDSGIVKSWFDEPCKNITEYIRCVLMQMTDDDFPTILMVGGFSAAPMFQEAMKRAFPQKRLHIPLDDPRLAAIQGAALFGYYPVFTLIEKYKERHTVCNKFFPGKKNIEVNMN